MTSRGRLAENARSTLLAVVPWVIGLYLAFAAVYVVAPPLTPGWIYATSMMVGVVMLSIVYFLVRRVPVQWVHPLLLVGSLIAVANSIVFIAASGQAAQTVVLIIVLLGSSYLFLSLTYTCITTALSVLAWTVVTWNFDSAVRMHWLINLGTASGVAVLITWSHSRLVTKLEAARASALSSVRAKSEFLANMSHELRTPMNGIVGIAHLLRAESLTHAQRDYVDTLIDSSNDLLTIVDDILDFARIDADKLCLQLQPFALAAQFQSVTKLLQPRAQSLGLDLALHIDADVPAGIIGDRARLRQVLINLIGNALKFTDTGTVRVNVSVVGEAKPTTLRVAVTDSGVGIPEDRMTAIFEPFSQVDGSSSRTRQGTGLGLTISRRLVQLMGGQLGAESVVGKGSTFWFTVPVKSAQPPAEHETSDQQQVAAQLRVDGATRILVVEDNEINQLIIVKLVEARGYQVDVCANGRSALDAVSGNDYGLVLMDCQLPDMDGYQVTATIRRGETADKHLPIIAVTAHAMRGDRERCLAAGMDDYLSKPLRPAKLAATLERWLPIAQRQVTSFIDAETLDDIVSRQGSAFFTDLLDRYVSDAKQRLAVMQSAHTDRNLDAIVFEAHSLKGSSAMIGAHSVMHLCSRVQTAAKNPDSAPELVSALAQLASELREMTSATVR